MNFMTIHNEWLEQRWRQQFPIRANRALDRLWFRYNPPRTEWWVKTAQWFIRRGKQIAGNYRYWRYMRGIKPNNWYFNYFHYDADKRESTLKSTRL